MNTAWKKRLLASLGRCIWLAVATLLVVTGIAAGTIGITAFGDPPLGKSPNATQNK